MWEQPRSMHVSQAPQMVLGTLKFEKGPLGNTVVGGGGPCNLGVNRSQLRSLSL